MHYGSMVHYSFLQCTCTMYSVHNTCMAPLITMTTDLASISHRLPTFAVHTGARLGGLGELVHVYNA